MSTIKGTDLTISEALRIGLEEIEWMEHAEGFEPSMNTYASVIDGVCLACLAGAAYMAENESGYIPKEASYVIRANALETAVKVSPLEDCLDYLRCGELASAFHIAEIRKSDDIPEFIQPYHYQRDPELAKWYWEQLADNLEACGF